MKGCFPLSDFGPSLPPKPGSSTKVISILCSIFQLFVEKYRKDVTFGSLEAKMFDLRGLP